MELQEKARCKSSDPVKELRGPILAPDCNKVCYMCVESLEKKQLPTLSLANGLWVGKIPDELKDLTYAEQLLIARVRHNRCIVKVSSGMFKMRANAISFSNPMPKIYNVLPPPIEELDEVLAFIYTGPCKPTKADFQRTPLLVRRLKVSKALHWLKLNHVDYYDCEIQTKIWPCILRKVLQWLWIIIHPVQIKIQSQQVYMIWKRRMAQQKVPVHL